MFYITFSDCYGSADCCHFDSAEEAQDALNSLYDAEEERSLLSRRDAISDLEQQIEQHLSQYNSDTL